MRVMTMSRRNLLAAGAIALAGTSGTSATVRARTRATPDATSEEIVRRY